MHQYKIHRADIKDFDTVYSMAMKFAKEYSPYWNEDSIKDLVINFLDDWSNKIVILCPDKGMLAAVINPFILDMTKSMATEIAWWVEPEYRDKGLGQELLEGFEIWAAGQGCNLMSMVGLSDDLGKYYEKSGYKLYERAYIKEI
jgi:GNAT superfamily N-acetyltransferase